MRKQENITLSIDESILRLKGEILAQDWRLTEKRADLLAAAFQCLKRRFKNRQAVNAILTMAENTLDFIHRNGESSPPECMDFLKEAMAHIVNIYEESSYVPTEDAKLFKSVYSRFAGVKTKIQGLRPEAVPQTGTFEDAGDAPAVPSSEPTQEEPPFFHLNGGHDEPDVNRLRRRIVHSSRSLAILQDALLSLSPLLARSGSVSQPLSPETEALISGLKETLHNTDALGRMIRDVLQNVRAGQERVSENLNVREEALSGGSVEEKKTPVPTAIATPESCPAMDLAGLILGQRLLFVPSEQIAIMRELTDSMRKHYLRKAAVPLKDFGRMLQPLSRQFRGDLAAIRSGRLRELKVPVIVPRGLDLPEEPLEDANWVVVLTHGPWNGAILCTGVTERNRTMVRYQRARNGDIAGIGFTQEGEELPLLDGVGFLKREGFKIAI